MKAVWDARADLPLDVRQASAAADEKRMRFQYDRITGKPQEDHTKFSRFTRAVMGYNFVRVMNPYGMGATAMDVRRLFVRFDVTNMEPT